MRTRIKICGITRVEDMLCAVENGADAIGFVFYERSRRYILPTHAAKIAAQVPPFVSIVGLFVNVTQETLRQVCAEVPLSQLQFHGDETAQQCLQLAQSVSKPYLPAARVTPELDLVKFRTAHQAANGLLLDAFVEGYGGGGKVFDWSLIPVALAPQVVLSGGLNAQNIAHAIERVRPYAVDVSSGVEAAKGIKDPTLIREFTKAVRDADQQYRSSI